MAINYIIKDASGTIKISLPPSGVDSPGGVHHNSSLTLYGESHTQWGRGIQQNLYRMLGNFSCASKVLNDYNPTTGLNNYNPSTQPILPKDYHDLGSENGINDPVSGQIWHNSTDNKLYYWTGSSWIAVGSAGGMPSGGSLGSLYYDTVSGELKVYNGSAWVNVGQNYLRLDGTSIMGGILDMNTHRIINVVDPTSNQDASTKKYVDDNIVTVNNTISTLTTTIGTDYYTKTAADSRYVNVAGDTMTGTLNITYGDALRIVQGNYGAIWRQDGAHLYLLFTNSGDQYGTWNSLRPFYANTSTGHVTIGNGLSVVGGLGVDGAVTMANGLTVTGGDISSNATYYFSWNGSGAYLNWDGSKIATPNAFHANGSISCSTTMYQNNSQQVLSLANYTTNNNPGVYSGECYQLNTGLKIQWGIGVTQNMMVGYGVYVYFPSSFVDTGYKLFIQANGYNLSPEFNDTLRTADHVFVASGFNPCVFYYLAIGY